MYAESLVEIINVLRENFRVERAKVTSAGVVYARIFGNERVEVDITSLPSELERVEGDFKLVDGGTIVVWTLRPEALLLEKVGAYMERCKARDLYDIYYLLDLCSLKFSVEARALKELILVGLPPSFSAFKRKVERYATAKV